MELLDYHYADEKVRTMAVAAVEGLLSNDELHHFLLQLVQVLECMTHVCNLVHVYDYHHCCCEVYSFLTGSLVG